MLRNQLSAFLHRIHIGKCLSTAALVLASCNASYAQTILYNNSFADGTRTTSSGVVQPVYVGASTTDNGTYFTTASETLNDAVNTVTGKMQNLVGSGSRKNWFYFTPDGQAPDANNPPTDVLTMSVGQTLTASMTFVIPTNVYTTGNVPGPSGNALSAASAQSDFRFGLFYDTNNARVQLDTNNDAGTNGSVTQPFVDSTGYAAFMGIGTNNTGTDTANTQFQLNKRSSIASPNLISSSSSYTTSTRGGTLVNETFGTTYTVQMVLHEVSATQMDVTSNMYQGSDTGTLLSTNTVSDLGTTFGGNAINDGGVPGDMLIYNKIDQFYFRMSTGAGAGSPDTSEIDMTNFKVTLATAPLRGDLNFDGHVDAKDLAALEAALTNTSGYLNTNFGNGTPASHGVTAANIGGYADVNGGTKFDNSDLQALLLYLKAGHGSATAVPEPASLVLAGLGALALGLVVRRRKQIA